jgi:hypothetical protein
MKKREKKAQIQLSFGMIFSIIIIIATLVVAFYVISYFLNLNKCTQIGLFYSSLQGEVNKAWQADMIQKTFAGKLPSGIAKLCFGNSSQMPLQEDREEYEYFKSHAKTGYNMLFYPAGKACDGELAFNKLEHIRTDNFFCVPVKSGNAGVVLFKESTDALVKLRKIE